ncbi:PREDICTED: receptor-like serine/threonine-protein kinase SD1-8 [Camelina sativa]|uniref:Receptor-like serine/threonine-protein kinase n=1 Tax=Camelina sativa TaxID=90675 RepID=A0ABM0YXD9_CAMSA|nr:PREDICTED: receptor-like serine/threonine-protein kinase SD1-8 [Camelina sativa]
MRTTKLSYHTLVILLSSLILFRLPLSCSLSTGENRTISANETIVSPGNVFELGLFRSASEHTPHWYLGIWYKNDPKKTRIWVANRYKPFYLSVGTLQFSDDDLVLSDENNSHVWSTTINRGGVRSPMVAQLLDNGNFVVKDSNNDEPDGFLWQSFDFPTDTLVPGMKLGMDLKTGTKEALTSWDPDIPSNTGYSFQLENQAGLYELFLVVQETSKHFYRSDLWDGIRFGDIPLEFSPTYVSSVWGNVSYVGFVMTGGCQRKTRLNCTGDQFLQLKNMKLPDTRGVTVAVGIEKQNCEIRCLSNCVCIAYAYVGRRKGQVGCVMWTGTLDDFQNYGVGGRDLYVKVAAIDHGDDESKTNNSTKSKGMDALKVTFITIIGLVGVALATFATYYCWKRHKRTIITHHGSTNTTVMNEVAGQTKFDLMSFTDVAEATNHFSEANKLGEGGFGVVYKGTLPNKTTVAVKRLAITSSQGINEFKTEVQTISNVIHKNLVRLQGCCLEDREQLLVYEYLKNSSLNYYIFDKTQSSLLNWEKRYFVIKGIVCGLSYLHNYVTPAIIHRDIKPSNILLGKDMIPKISDFGMAKLLDSGDTKATTNRAVGTRGYMSEEYALHGKMSERSDIFSFGVTLLEIVTGKRNIEFCNYYHGDSMLDYVWRHFDEGNSLQVVDPNFVDCSLVEEEVVRCIQVALLCVQQDVDDRPSTESVALMLATTMMEIPIPKKPNYFYARFLSDMASSSTVKESTSINQVTLSSIISR